MVSHSIAVVLVVMLSISSALAQQQKIGYVNTDEILSQMSEYEGIQKQLGTLSSEWNNRLSEMEDEIDSLEEDFEAKEILYTDDLKEQKLQEIENKVNQRQQYIDEKFSSEGEYFQKQKELLEPIQRKIFEAINVIANEQGFDFVFDRAQNSSMLYGDDQWNLNEEVLQELGITLNEASN
ncbi:MAG: OmpH family outer membrane protein [Bacteroidota bacterium]